MLRSARRYCVVNSDLAILKRFLTCVQPASRLRWSGERYSAERSQSVRIDAKRQVTNRTFRCLTEKIAVPGISAKDSESKTSDRILNQAYREMNSVHLQIG